MLAAADRQRRALELRKAGMTYDAIVRQLGYASHAGALKAVTKALKAVAADGVDELRRLEAERLDRLQFGVWQAAVGGDLDAIATVLRIMQRRAKLFALDQTPARDQGLNVVLQLYATKAAEAAGLEPSVVLAEAERILAEVSGSS